MSFAISPLFSHLSGVNITNASLSISPTGQDFQKQQIFTWVQEKSLIPKTANASLASSTSTVGKVGINPAMAQTIFLQPIGKEARWLL